MDEIRLDAAPLSMAEEIRANFEGRSELEAQIVAAHEAGDEVRLRNLQAEYRSRAHNLARATSGINPRVNSQEARLTDPKHSLGGVALTWAATVKSYTGGGQPCYVRSDRHALDQWLARTRLSTVPIIWRHGSEYERFGNLVHATPDDLGLHVVAQLDARPAIDELLRAADDGALGLSVYCVIEDSIESGELIRGLPLFISTRESLREVSFTLAGEQADPAAIITHVGGHEARYRTDQALTKFRDLFGGARNSTIIESNPGQFPKEWRPRFGR